jgi:GTPase SAR1 family protein
VPADVVSARCAIPIFLFVNKGDLMAQSTVTEDMLQQFTVSNQFTDYLLTSAKDHARTVDAFQTVADYVVVHQDGDTHADAQQGNSSITLNALRKSTLLRHSEDQNKGEKKCCDK